jgi:mannobiose 2-epimerase
VDTEARLSGLRDAMMGDLRANVLPFWFGRVLDERAGFHGLVGDDGRPAPAAPLGGVLCARLLWTFSAAYRRTGDPAHRRAADHFHAWLTGPFHDPRHGGVYWLLDHEGRPIADRKQTYALAFALYGLAEHHLATGSQESLAQAVDLFRLIEERAADREHGGYFEAHARDWGALDDVRLSEKDLNAPKSMNTHLHVMEALAALARAGGGAAVREALATVVRLHLERIFDADTGHLCPFFDERFAPLSRAVSFGHDVEASWLLVEAADETGDAALVARARAAAILMSDVALAEGFDPVHGGLFAERGEDARLDDEKHWWMQAEAIVGFLNAFEISHREAFLDAALRTWSFVERFLVDGVHGEWRWRVERDGTPIPGLPKVEPWKCPYHNSRAALEVDVRTGRLVAR